MTLRRLHNGCDSVRVLTRLLLFSFFFVSFKNLLSDFFCVSVLWFLGGFRSTNILSSGGVSVGSEPLTDVWERVSSRLGGEGGGA